MTTRGVELAERIRGEVGELDRMVARSQRIWARAR